MRSVMIALAGAVALGAVGAPAQAQTATDRADVRCILVLTLASRDPRNKDSAEKGTLYYIGRLDGHGIGPKLESTMLAESKAMNNAATIQSELTRCGAELNKRGADLKATFTRLQAQASPPPAAAPAKAAPAK